MKNYEKYADEIKNYNGDRFCKDFITNRIIKNNDCEEKDCNKCILLQFLWLMEEYKEQEEPEVNWGKVEVDTPLLVRDNKLSSWYKRYFAKYENGMVYAWVEGATSWTANGEMMAWTYAKLAEEGDK